MLSNRSGVQIHIREVFQSVSLISSKIIKRLIKCSILKRLQSRAEIFSKTPTTVMFQMRRSSLMATKLPTTPTELAETPTSTEMPVDSTRLTFRHQVWEFHHLIRGEYRQQRLHPSLHRLGFITTAMEQVVTATSGLMKGALLYERALLTQKLRLKTVYVRIDHDNSASLNMEDIM